MYGALVASLGVVALVFGANDVSARSGTGNRAAFASTRAFSHPLTARALRHHRRNNLGTVWPAVADPFAGPSYGGPVADVTAPGSADVHYTYTHDVPWDWAHRYPPAVVPSDRPYVSSCPAETVTVPGRDGSEQTVNVIRCY
jgi:hypothetical protein